MLCIKNSIWKSFSGNEKKDESASGIKRNTISRPTAYGEYAPYTFIENEEEFHKLVQKIKKQNATAESKVTADIKKTRHWE